MKVSRVFYNDDDILVRGHLIRRLFHRPVFFRGNAGLTIST